MGAGKIMWFTVHGLRVFCSAWQQVLIAWRQLWRLSSLPVMGYLLFSTWLPGSGIWSLLRRAGSPITMSFTAWATCCLNFSAVPCQTLSFFMISPCGYLPPRHCGRMSQDSLCCDCILFSIPQNSSVSNNRPPLQDGTSLQLSEIWGVTTWIYSPMQACHTGGVIVTPNSHTI
jgi:hypothetical protein